MSNEYALSYYVMNSGDGRHILVCGTIKQEMKKGRSKARGPCGVIGMKEN